MYLLFYMVSVLFYICVLCSVYNYPPMVHIVGQIAIKSKVFLCPGGNLIDNVIFEQRTIIYSFGLCDFHHVFNFISSS